MRISEINVYPVKSLGKISLNESRIEKRGLRFDRRFMIVDENGEFFTQRDIPNMATICVEIDGDYLTLKKGETPRESLRIPFEFEKTETKKVRVWNSFCEASVLPENVNEWISDVLETKCLMVFMPDETRREINPRFRQNDEIVSFADGYPFLLIGENSLNNLNERLVEKLPMNRFRPNLVVSGSEAFAEDVWKRIRIGKTVFRSTKPCARCVITTVDQEEGFSKGKEPLKTLAEFRRAKDVFPDDYEFFELDKNAVLFGQNLVAENFAEIVKIGDEVEVLETG